MTQKVFISNEDKATFICPECKRSKTTSVSKYKAWETAVRVNCKCPCGHTYSVLLERRKHVRKPLNLPGTYQLLNKNNRGRMKVVDMSRSGLRLEVFYPKDFAPGDRVRLTFNLDDPDQTTIIKEVHVRSVKNNFIGVEFISFEHYDKLGPYILYRIE